MQEFGPQAAVASYITVVRSRPPLLGIDHVRTFECILEVVSLADSPTRKGRSPARLVHDSRGKGETFGPRNDYFHTAHGSHVHRSRRYR